VVTRAHPGELPTVVGRPLEALEANASGLKALGHLRDLVHGPWPKGVSPQEVEAGANAFAQTASPADAAVMRRYLGLRARMEERPDVARQLLRPADHRDAQTVLRDLEVLAEVSAAPPPASPLSDLPLPEPEMAGFKASVREALDRDLPGLARELPAAELRARRGALRAIEASAGKQWHLVAISLHNVKSASADNGPDDREAEVERQLGRPLRPEERPLVRRLLRSKTTAEVVAVLRRLDRE
jgi:hypothetical protein